MTTEETRVAGATALGEVVPVPATSSPDRYEVTLPSGAKAHILKKARGKHVVLAHRMSGNEGGIKFVFGLIAVKATVDGRALTIEDVEEQLEDLDVMYLMAAVQGKDPSSQPAT